MPELKIDIQYNQCVNLLYARSQEISLSTGEFFLCNKPKKDNTFKTMGLLFGL